MVWHRDNSIMNGIVETIMENIVIVGLFVGNEKEVKANEKSGGVGAG